MALVRDLYDRLALMTGFPAYTNDTDTPEITRFLLEMLSEGLQSVIDSLYTANNVLERNDTIITTPYVSKYGISGTIKNIELYNGKCVKPLPYLDRFNPHFISKQEIQEEERIASGDTTEQEEPQERKDCGEPVGYVIQDGYLRLVPTPNKAYTVKVCVSTTNLVATDDDTSREYISHINDAILADDKFCNLVVIKSAALTFLRAQNPNVQFYQQLFEDRLKTYMEHDIKSIEAQRGFSRKAGHFDPYRGLLDDRRY